MTQAQNSPNQIIRLVLAFNAALNARDLDAMLSLMTPDCVFENTYPPPDGARYVGIAAVRGFWEGFFQGSARAHIQPEEVFALDNRCVMRWVYTWGDTGHIRGVDLYTVRAGLISEKLSYVKG